ncbi:MAG: PP2C family protein-serine/threonine phosphatase [Acidimicrobiales bacterium]
MLTTVIRVIWPLRALTASARAVADGELRAEVPVSGPQEFRALGADVGAMRYRLLEEINRARLAAEALRHDGPTVAALHEALAPRHDQVPGVIAVGRLDPAEGVLAGDWYDLIRIGDSLAMVIGDVSGHGPASAVLALGLRAVISTVLTGGGSPGEALAAAAASVADETPEHFATVFVAVIDPAAGRLRYGNAGHPAAIVHRAASLDGAWTELAPTGPLLSPVVARWNWSTQTQAFEAGDALLAYTDGITEGRNATNEEYGIERLKHDVDATLPRLLNDAVNLIAANVNRFVGASQSDDRTLVYCLRPLGSQAALR